MDVTLGGDRLGAGNKQKVDLRTYERSTHDYSSIFKSSMASGTLVPFMSEIALPSDSWEIELDCDIMTLPTIGPLFGSYKVQLDVFVAPIRLYQGALNMNLVGVGLKMEEIYLPKVELNYKIKDRERWLDGSQINNSSIFAYFNIRGLGNGSGAYNVNSTMKRKFNSTDWINYWNVYKQYYANKQEGIGAMIHNSMNESSNDISTMTLYKLVIQGAFDEIVNVNPYNNTHEYVDVRLKNDSQLVITFNDSELPNYDAICIDYTLGGDNLLQIIELMALFFAISCPLLT